MKKKIITLVLTAIALALCMLMFGCGNDGGSDGEDATNDVMHVAPICRANVNVNYAETEESFYDSQNNYYMYSMGTISNVPLETPVFFYYGGEGNVEQTFTKSTTSVSSIATTVQQTVTKRIMWENYAEIGAEIESGLDDIGKAAISAKISGKEGYESETTDILSYKEFQQWSETREKTIKIKFDTNYKAGYYAYVVSATVKVRAVVVSDRTTDEKSASTYNELVGFGYSFAYNKDQQQLLKDLQNNFRFNFDAIGDLDEPTQFIDVKGEYTKIKSAADFNGINEDLNGKYVLINDIDFNGATIAPIGTVGKDFTGTLNGCGHTIGNYKISSILSVCGLFARNRGVIENLNISRASVSTDCVADNVLAGILVGENRGKISNCRISDSAMSARAIDSDNTENSSRYAIVGGVVGKITEGTIKGCSVERCTIYGFVKKHDKAWSNGWNEAAYAYIGGIVGEQYGGIVINNVTLSLTKIEGKAEYRGNAAIVVISITTRSRICLGGVIGRQVADTVQSGNASSASFDIYAHSFNSYNSTNKVEPIEEYKQGQIVGYID